mgnify:CR=1 FL=1
MNDKKALFTHKLNAAEAKVQRVQQQQKAEMEHRKNLERLRMLDKQENIERIKSIQEYRKEKILEKIEKDNERAYLIKKTREDLIAIRQKIRREMDEQKEKIVNDFYAKQKRNRVIFF